MAAYAHFDGGELARTAGVRWTRTTDVDGETNRYFLTQPLVVAASALDESVTPADKVEELLRHYGRQPGFGVYDDPDVQVADPTNQATKKFAWRSDTGDRQVSWLLVAAGDSGAWVVHVIAPAGLAEDLEGDVLGILRSTVL